MNEEGLKPKMDKTLTYYLRGITVRYNQDRSQYQFCKVYSQNHKAGTPEHPWLSKEEAEQEAKYLDKEPVFLDEYSIGDGK